MKFGIPDMFVEHGDIESLRTITGLKGELMADKIMKYLEADEENKA